MAETTKKATEEATPANVTKYIAADEEIWEADGEDESGLKHPPFLTLEDQLGIIELELTQPVELTDREEPLKVLQLKAPTRQDISRSQGRVDQICNACVVGINPKDLSNMHGRDYVRLQKVVRHFLS